jgi:hypothetical protein
MNTSRKSRVRVSPFDKHLWLFLYDGLLLEFDANAADGELLFWAGCASAVGRSNGQTNLSPASLHLAEDLRTLGAGAP